MEKQNDEQLYYKAMKRNNPVVYVEAVKAEALQEISETLNGILEQLERWELTGRI